MYFLIAIPITYLVLSVLEREDQHEGKYIRPKKFKCSNEQNARKVCTWACLSVCLSVCLRLTDSVFEKLMNIKCNFKT